MRKPACGNPDVAIAYVRVSTDEQKLGPEAQRAAIEAWALREKVTIGSWHEDLGVSGGSDLAARPGLSAALAAVRASKAATLFVAKRDRLARDVAIATTIERAVLSMGARVVSADGVANGTGPADDFMRTILDAAAQYERALIRGRTKAALVAKRARGERTGTVPFGFRLGDDGLRLIVDPAEREVERLACELRASGLSVRAVTHALYERGRVSRRGKPFSVAAVHRMTSRPLGAGAGS